MPSVLIVDDEDDMRLLLRIAVERSNDVTVLGEARSGDEALRQWRELRPDVVLLDQRLAGLSGLETAERILSEDPEQVVILLSAYLDAEARRAAEQIGVTACVDKRDLDTVVDLVLAVQRPTNHEAGT